MIRKRWLAVLAMVLGLTGSAGAATYNCLPVEITEKADHVRVDCARPSDFEDGYPRDGNNRIRFFAVAKTDPEFAKRFVYVAQTALTAGMVVQLQYTSGDTSGAAFDCDPTACRKPWAVGLLAPATDVRIPHAVWPSGATESIAQGSWLHYGPFSISQYRKLVVKMTGTGNADLYVRRGDPPTETSFTCRPQLVISNEDCTMPPPTPAERAATYYVGVRGVGASNTYKLTVSIKSN